ncbi:hypothetical protein TWF281_003042 [Arthrobotrys megalospora]
MIQSLVDLSSPWNQNRRTLEGRRLTDVPWTDDHNSSQRRTALSARKVLSGTTASLRTQHSRPDSAPMTKFKSIFGRPLGPDGIDGGQQAPGASHIRSDFRLKLSYIGGIGVLEVDSCRTM